MSVSEPLTAHPGSFNEEGDYAGEQHLLEEVQSLNIDTSTFSLYFPAESG